MNTRFKQDTNKLLDKFGYRLSNVKYLHGDVFGESNFRNIFDAWNQFTMRNPERAYALYRSVNYVVDGKIPGDFVECGVWRGGSCMIMAESLILKGDRTRNIWPYDLLDQRTKTITAIRTL